MAVLPIKCPSSFLRRRRASARSKSPLLLSSSLTSSQYCINTAPGHSPSAWSIIPLGFFATSPHCFLRILPHNLSGNFSHTWPLISLTSPSFIGVCLLIIADHFLWFFHFTDISKDSRHNRSFCGALKRRPRLYRNRDVLRNLCPDGPSVLILQPQRERQRHSGDSCWCRR